MAKLEFDESLIRRLSELLEETGLSEIEYEAEGYRIRVARNSRCWSTPEIWSAVASRLNQVESVYCTRSLILNLMRSISRWTRYTGFALCQNNMSVTGYWWQARRLRTSSYWSRNSGAEAAITALTGRTEACGTWFVKPVTMVYIAWPWFHA